MSNFDGDFLRFVRSCNAVQYGEFTLKDGSQSDIFFNSATFNTGHKIKCLARFLAQKIFSVCPNCNLVYGSAYKGIPLATAVAMELGHISGISVGYLFDRKEEKTHGDKGTFVGKTPSGNDEVVFVDDVVTSGKTKVEGIQLIKSTFGTDINHIFVAVDRRNEISDINGCQVHSLATLESLRSFLKTKAKT